MKFEEIKYKIDLHKDMLPARDGAEISAQVFCPQMSSFFYRIAQVPQEFQGTQ